jgi:Zn-dependent peptidase ImmA (M78 family)
MNTTSGNREKAVSLLKMAGISNPPIDVNKVAKVLGFDVIPFDYPDEFSGEIYIEGDIKSIGVNEKHSKSRQRFTIAHEIGHYINGHTYYDKTGKTYKDESFDFCNPLHQQEKEANMFAAELLVPKEFIKKDLDNFGLDILKLTELYQVSEQMMWIRLSSLGLADKYKKA